MDRYTRTDVENIAFNVLKHMKAAELVPAESVVIVHKGSSTNGIAWRVEAWSHFYGSGTRELTLLDNLHYGTTARGAYEQLRTVLETLRAVNAAAGRDVYSRVRSVTKGHTRKDGTTSYRVTMNKAVNGRKCFIVEYAGGEYADVLGWNGDGNGEDEVINLAARTADGRETFPPNNETTIRHALEDLADFYLTGE